MKSTLPYPLPGWNMHELSVTESILEIAVRHAENANTKQITAVHLVIGELSSVIDDSVQFYWDILAKNTLAEGAKLVFRRIPTELGCQDCGEVYRPNGHDMACPRCDSTHIRVLAGEEFFVEAIEVETQ